MRSADLLVWLLVLTWRRRREPLAPWLAAALGALLLWTVGYAFELASVSLQAKLFWANLQYVGLLSMPVLWLRVTQRALGWDDIARAVWLTLTAVSVALMATVYLNPGHLFRGQPSLVLGGPVPLVSPDYGPLFYVLCVPFSLSLAVVSLVGFARTARSGLPLYRARAFLLLAAMLLPVVGGALYMAGALPWRDFDPASATLSVAAILCGVALLRYRTFDVAPLAREALVDQLADGIVVTNERGLLIDFNAAAADILPELRAGLSARRSPRCSRRDPSSRAPWASRGPAMTRVARTASRARPPVCATTRPSSRSTRRCRVPRCGGATSASCGPPCATAAGACSARPSCCTI